MLFCLERQRLKFYMLGLYIDTLEPSLHSLRTYIHILFREGCTLQHMHAVMNSMYISACTMYSMHVDAVVFIVSVSNALWFPIR